MLEGVEIAWCMATRHYSFTAFSHFNNSLCSLSSLSQPQLVVGAVTWITMSTPTAKDEKKIPLDAILRKAGKRALGGGVPGAIAMGAQVVTLMPLRTTMNVSSHYRAYSTLSLPVDRDPHTFFSLPSLRLQTAVP